MHTFATFPRNLYVSLRTSCPFIGTLNVLKAQLLQAFLEEYGAAGSDTSRLKPFFQRLAYRHTDILRSRIYVLFFFFFFFSFFYSFDDFGTTRDLKRRTLERVVWIVWQSGITSKCVFFFSIFYAAVSRNDQLQDIVIFFNLITFII